jgi:hypothetical protein
VNSVQLLHGKRGRPEGAVVRTMREHFPEKSRRSWYYQAAIDRAQVLMVEAGLMAREHRVRGERWPLPYVVMAQIGRRSRPDAAVLWLARLALDYRAEGYTTASLLDWLRST